MNRDEAKYILCAYHLGGQDSDDPQFREALEMLKRDLVLAEWFEREQLLDTRLSEKFRSFPVPPDLKAQLLAARKVVSFPVWWKRPAWITAAAACAALLATLVRLLTSSPSEKQFVEFRSFAADAAAKLDHLDLSSRDLAEVRQWLQNRSAPSDFTLPTSLNGSPSLGCRMFEWKGQKVSLVCFELENRHVVHLFVMDRAVLRDVPAGGVPQFAVMSGITTASWSNDKCVYVLASHSDKQELKRLL